MKLLEVAPPVGAWIEIISTEDTKEAFTSSLPLWERGLKLPP